MSDTGIGASVRRVEDHRFITGQGRFTDDLTRPGQAYGQFVRSPVAHAEIRGVAIGAALRVPGVLDVVTGAHLQESGVGTLPCGWGVTDRDGKPMAEPPFPLLATDKVRFVGNPIALVIAESRQAARDAAELVEVDYAELPAVVTAAAALGESAPQLHSDVPANLCFDWDLGDKDAADAAFASAASVVKLDLTNNRLVASPMEPRCYIAEYDGGKDEYTLYTTTQNPHVIRMLMCAFVLALPEHKVRVVAPDVGGGFGTKICHYAEEAVLTWSAKRVGRPIKWTADRSEAFISDSQGRDHQSHAELALDADGRFLGLRVETLANLGAYLSTFGSAVPTYMYAPLLSGTYRIAGIHANVKAVFTNTVPVDAYRGAGRPEATFLLERLIDKAARELGFDPVALRRRNFIPQDAFPYATPVLMEYDTGDYDATLDAALELADWEGFAARRDRSAEQGRLRGIGLACYIEACGIAPSNVVGQLGARAGLYEAATVRVNPTGSVTVLTGSHSHGQGHETTFAQLVNEKLGVDIANVEIVHGDTGRIPFGLGTYGSRSMAVGGVALMNAMDKVIAKGSQVAAHLLEASRDDIEFADGRFRVAGTDRTVGFQDVAMAAYVPHNYPIEDVEPGLEETAFYDPKNFTFPAGAHVCEVEIEPDTGVVRIVGYSVADDFGRVINPLIVEGQVHGGVAQGVGQALLEHCIYDEDSGQLLTGSYMDYCLPRADDLAAPNVATEVTACTHNVLGVKGCGEAGAIGAPPAVVNAIVDATGVDHIDMPATPERVWRALRKVRAA